MNIAVMGYGVVGSGVVEVFYKNHAQVLNRAKCDELEITRILDIRDFPDSPYADKFTKSFEDILNDDSIKIVVETMGGLKPAYDFVKRCLLASKHVATSNKELVAVYGDELLAIAREKNINFLFEASVGGGIPIIRPINQCLVANEINAISGILNGTTNYILTKMIKEGTTFDAALSEAQALGYAERNPAADIEGLDTCRKVCILASLAFGKHVFPDQVHTDGITGIAPEDVKYASSWGGVIKLLGWIKRLPDERVSAIVSPAFVPSTSQLAGVDDVFNAILVKGDATGDVVFYGRGAGKLPTASAVVADVVDCVRHFKNRRMLDWDKGYPDYVIPYENVESAFYVRGLCADKVSAVRMIKTAFGDYRELSRADAPEDELAFTTPVVSVAALKSKLASINGFTVKSFIRISDD